MKTYGKYDDELFEIVTKDDHKDDHIDNTSDDLLSDLNTTCCGCFSGLNIICSYMKLSDIYFESFTEKSLALTITLFKFVKVVDDFSNALELLVNSCERIYAIVRLS